MTWQLWVLITLVATGVVILAVIRMRHAQHVFDDITTLDRPAESDIPADLPGDELSRARARRSEPEPSRRRSHG
jgi:hypothetical protein